ncbi:MAG: hypothetical protein Q7T82_16365 [Armatimonadota bacterium]|nr:hypothetical protein [Armatimonadota bacterium]
MRQRVSLTLAALLLVTCATAWVSQPAAAGKLRMYFDTDRDGQYDAGEQISSGQLWYHYKTAGTLLSANIAADGTVTLNNVAKDDKLYARFLVRSETAAKGTRNLAGAMFDLYADTDTVKSNGDMVRRALTSGEAQTINSGGTVNVWTSHPVFSWNLMVALDWNADADYRSKLRAGFRSASKYLFDVTDGHMKYGKIDIRNNIGHSSQTYLDADIRIKNDSTWPHATIDGVTSDSVNYNHHIWLPKNFNSINTWTGNPDEANYYRTIVHECGHYLLELFDEYLNGNGNESAWDDYRFWNHDKAPSNYGLMDDQYNSSEMSSNNDYLGNYVGKSADKCTNEIWWWNVRSGGGHRPCWQHVFDRFDNRNGTQGNWGGYGGRRIALLMPPDGVYQGYDWLNGEKRSSSDRGGPGDIPRYLSAFVLWEYCEFPSGTSSPASQEPQGAPEPASGLQAAIITGNGPRLILDAGIAPAGVENTLTMMVVADRPLVGPPQVFVRPSFGSQVPVPMTPAGPNIFQGSVNIGSEHDDGGVDVTAASSGGQTQLSTNFSVQKTRADRPPMLFSPDAWQESLLPAGILTQSVLAVTLDSGDAPILPVPPMNPAMEFLANPVSFHLQSGASGGSNYTINWRINPDLMPGRDSSTMTLCRFEISTKEWVPVTAVVRAGWPRVSAEGLAEGIYTVLAFPSADTTAPGPITNLSAVTGQSGKSVSLTWTSPGDDGNTGQAARYHVYFNTVPITVGNLTTCSEFDFLDRPLAAGQVEQHGLEMPDPNTLYYFAIKTQDEAGSLGALSNVDDATSYVLDTDGDGLSDQWEEAYGFDPNNAGEQSLDPDDDGLTNLQEYQTGTNPTDPDTDGEGLSDGLEVSASTSPLDGGDPIVANASSAKAYTDGQKLGLPLLVTTVSAYLTTYGQEQNGSAGIRLEGIAAPVGKMIEVIGTTATTEGGEKCLSGCYYRERWDAAANPVAMSNRMVGGGPFGLQEGIPGASGLNDMGLLVTSCGRFFYLSEFAFEIDDGSGTPVKCYVYPGAYVSEGWQYVAVTGAAACEKDISNNLRRVIFIRSPFDVSTFLLGEN